MQRIHIDYSTKVKYIREWHGLGCDDFSQRSHQLVSNLLETAAADRLLAALKQRAQPENENVFFKVKSSKVAAGDPCSYRVVIELKDVLLPLSEFSFDVLTLIPLKAFMNKHNAPFGCKFWKLDPIFGLIYHVETAFLEPSKITALCESLEDEFLHAGHHAHFTQELINDYKLNLHMRVTKTGKTYFLDPEYQIRLAETLERVRSFERSLSFYGRDPQAPADAVYPDAPAQGVFKGYL